MRSTTRGDEACSNKKLDLAVNCYYNSLVRIEFDANKSDANVQNRGLSFELVACMCCALPPWLEAFVSSAFARPIDERYETMTKRTPIIDNDGEVRELTGADMKHFKPAAQVLPPELYAGLLEINRRAGVRGPQKKPTKVSTTIRLSPDVVQAFKSGGDGWQSRIDAALKDWLRTHSAA